MDCPMMRCVLLQHLSFSQVIYMVPISVGSPSMGVMEGNPGPEPLQVVGTTTPAVARLDARGQRGQTEMPAPGEKVL